MRMGLLIAVISAIGSIAFLLQGCGGGSSPSPTPTPTPTQPPSAAVPGIGKSTYAMSHPFLWKEFMEKYFPTAENMVRKNNTNTCVEWVKLCIDDGHMNQCKGPHGNFQIHAVGAYKRDSGSKSMEQIETEFTQSMGNLGKFGPFFDYNIGLVTSDLDPYISAFDGDKVPYFSSTFTDPATKQQYNTILVQTPGSLSADAKSLISIEIMSLKSSLLATRIGLHNHSLPRASPTGLASAEQRLARALQDHGSNGMPVLTMIHISFASSDLDRDVRYFEDVWMGTKVYSANADDGKVYAGKMLSSDGAEIIYRQTNAGSQGPMTVAQWETYQKELHAHCFNTASNEGFDRLADNHMGRNLGSVALDSYIQAQKTAGLPHRFYGGPGGKAPPYFLYLYGQNGWGNQFVGECKDAALCPSSVKFYDMCKQGISGDCSHDQMSAILDV